MEPEIMAAELRIKSIQRSPIVRIHTEHAKSIAAFIQFY